MDCSEDYPTHNGTMSARRYGKSVSVMEVDAKPTASDLHSASIGSFDGTEYHMGVEFSMK